MIFLSKLLHQHIYDIDNRRVGTLRDICVALNETFPVITGLVIHPVSGSGQVIIPWNEVQSIEETPLHLTISQAEMHTYEPQTSELLLKRDILDKQIVDTLGFRVVKVNDLKLAQIKKTARLVGVDISFSGIMRRLGWQRAVDLIGRITPLHLEERTVTWNYVEPIEVVSVNTGQLAPAMAGAVSTGAVGVVPRLQLNVSQNKLANLHPADIADILEQLDVEEAGAMLERLDDEIAADTLNEVTYPLQYELLSELDPERASDLLERLAPDDAADILADIPVEEAEHLLSLMPRAESQPIRDLLRYNAQTAGGIMTPEILAQPQEATVEEVLVYLRQHSSQLDMVYYLYVIDEERHLIGVASLRQLITAEPQTRLEELMDRETIKVRVDTDQEEVARVIAKYDLLGVPVVDEENHLLGMVTVDDVIDVIHEEQAEDVSEMTGTDVEESEEEDGSWLRSSLSRSSWLVLNVLAGVIMALLLGRVFNPLFSISTALAMTSGIMPREDARLALSSIFCLTPMLLLTSGTVGAQSLGIAGWELKTKRGKDFLRGLWRELLHGTVGGVTISILVGIVALLLFRSPLLSVAVALGFGITLLIAAICGMALPNLLQRLRVKGSFASAPLVNPLIAVASMGTFLGVTISLLNEFFR